MRGCLYFIGEVSSGLKNKGMFRYCIGVVDLLVEVRCDLEEDDVCVAGDDLEEEAWIVCCFCVEELVLGVLLVVRESRLGSVDVKFVHSMNNARG